MIRSTLSFHMGARINEKHNNRTIPVPHSDAEYAEQHNWYWPHNITLESASQSVSAELRSGDIEKISAGLNEYEHQLEQTQNTVLSSAPIVKHPNKSVER